MFNRKSLLASGIATAIFAVSGVSAATLQSSHAGSAASPTFNIPFGTTVLYDQTNNPSANGAPVQNFSSSYDAYDSEAADDFVVPAGGWTISSFNMVTTVGSPLTTTASVNIYPDVAGLPGGAPACSYAAAPANVTTAGTTITLPTTCSLGAGNFWFAVSVDVDFGVAGQIFWSTRNTQSNSIGVWRNPGDGFASGCTNWAPLASCGGATPVGGGFPDYLFQVVGAVGGGGVIPLEPARELPTLSQWSALLAAGGLALLGLFGVRRRSRG